MNPWNYTDLMLDRECQRRENISYFVFHIIEVTRESPGKTRTVSLPRIHRNPLILNTLLRRSF